MDEKDTDSQKHEKETPAADEQEPEVAEHPVPGVHHEQEPDAENIMPAEDRPGTL